MVGRVTLNPWSRRPIGTLLFPALMIFGRLSAFSMFGGMLVAGPNHTINTRTSARLSATTT